MDTFKLSQPPYNFMYHKDWTEILILIMPEYEKRIKWFIKENPEVTPDLDDIFKIFQHSFKNRKVLLVFPEPCKGQNPGLPGSVLNITSDPLIRNFVTRLTVNHLKITLPSSFRPLASPDIFAWNICLTGTGKPHLDFWKDFSCSVLNHIQSYISIFCFIGWTGINFKQDLNLKKTIVLKTGSLIHKESKWNSNQNKCFEILDAILNLKYPNSGLLKWENCFV